MSSNTNPLKVLVVGGVAGGASAAARLRRLSEEAVITIVERGPDVSFANCGLPYHIGGEIPDRGVLAIQNPVSFKAMLNVNVLTRTEATTIDRSAKQVEVKDLTTGDSRKLDYDKLVLSPGASPIIPPLPGIDDTRIKTLRNLSDMDNIKTAANDASRVLVIGAGFIGLEMVEQLVHMGKSVTLVELQPQVLPQLDIEMTAPIVEVLKNKGISVHLGDGIAGFEDKNSYLLAKLNSGASVETDLVILSIGVKPETAIARAANLELGPRGHIVVNKFQQTSDPDIYAAGDAVQTWNPITETFCAVPLGGPANRQGRVVADHIADPEKARPYPGSIGTAIVRIFDLTTGVTGQTVNNLQRSGILHKQVIVSDFHHANYYPGARLLTVKIAWDPTTGKLLGGQVVGTEGVDKRIDILATALRGGLTIYDLEHLELAYAPPFGSAKDILNVAGFTAGNIEDGRLDVITELPDIDGSVQILDVRPPHMRSGSEIPGSLEIPFGQLRKRLSELDKSRPVVTVCKLGKTSYFAFRLLRQKGYEVKSYIGGLLVRAR